MQTTRFIRLPGLALAVMLTLLGVGGCGDDDNDNNDNNDKAQAQAIIGSWNVTLRFPASSCNNACN